MGPSSNSFVVLNSVDDSNLNTIALDCDVILGGNVEEQTFTLDAMKLEELSRAALAEANYKTHLEERLLQTHLLEGETLI